MESRDFEKQIHRIHSLLEAENAVVTWNDRIRDPDNPDQLRQIDVTIKRADTLTLIECRLHKAKQDVKWIEELIGREQSLRADTVIAVSASGFTSNAISKAGHFGVILRDFETLSDTEVCNWGKLSSYKIIFYEFKDVLVTLEMPPTFRADSTSNLSTTSGEPINWHGLLSELAKNYDLNKMKGQQAEFQCRLTAPITLNKTLPLKTFAKGKIRSIELEEKIAMVAIYKDAEPEANPDATVIRFGSNDAQIIKGVEISSLVFDISNVEVPENCIFGYPLFFFDQGLRVGKFEVIGAAKALECRVPITVQAALSNNEFR